MQKGPDRNKFLSIDSASLTPRRSTVEPQGMSYLIFFNCQILIPQVLLPAPGLEPKWSDTFKGMLSVENVL